MQRAAQVFQQKANRHEVKKDTERARNAVVGRAAFAIDVFDRYFADGSSMPRGQRGYEAMQFAVERDLLENLAAIGLESGPEIVNVDAAELGHQPVRASRGDAPQPEIVDALFAPAADDVVTLGDL